MNWLWIFIIVGILYIIWTGRQNSIETFTTADVEFANKLVNFFKTPNTYISYVQFLVTNKNKSANLSLMTTYKALAEKSANLTVSDILSQL